MPALTQKPRPAIDELSKPFWAAAQKHQLVIQRCINCNTYNHPPRVLCNVCRAKTLRFVRVTGRGKIYSFSIMHQPNVPGFDQELPYINIIVELEEQAGLFLVSDMPEAERHNVRIGAKVTVYFHDIDKELTLPKFSLNA